jgi:hypothetical protein
MTKHRWIIRFAYKAPVVVVGFLGAMYAVALVMRFKEDTSAITNAAFAAMATLAALSFSFARAAEENLRDRITFAGERFLHGAILVLVVSIIKYFIYLLYQDPQFGASSWAGPFVEYSIGILIAVVFANGVLFAHTGLRVLSDLLLSRFTRYADWDAVA